MNFFKIFNIYPYLKNITSIFVLQGIGAIMTFVSQIYLIKILGLDEYGLFVFLTALIMPISSIAVFGFNISLIKYINEYLISKRIDLIRGIISFSFFFTSLISFGLTIAGILIIIMLNDNDFLYYLLAFILIPLNTTNSIFDAILKSKKKFNTSFFLSSIYKTSIILTCVLYCYFCKINFNLYDFLYLNIILSVIQIFINMFFLKFHYNEIFKTTSSFRKKEWLNTSSPILLSNLSFRVLTYSDVIFVKVFLGNELVGLYNLMCKSLMLLDMLSVSINTVKTPDFSQIFATKNLNKLKLDFFNSRNLMFFLTIFLSLCLYYIMPLIFNYTGNDFSILLIPFIIIIFSKYVSAFAGPSGVFLNMVNKQKLHMKITVLSGFLYIFFGILLTKYFDLIGISIATLIGYGFVNLIKHYYALKVLESSILDSIKNIKIKIL